MSRTSSSPDPDARIDTWRRGVRDPSECSLGSRRDSDSKSNTSEAARSGPVTAFETSHERSTLCDPSPGEPAPSRRTRRTETDRVLVTPNTRLLSPVSVAPRDVPLDSQPEEGLIRLSPSAEPFDCPPCTIQATIPSSLSAPARFHMQSRIRGPSLRRSRPAPPHVTVQPPVSAPRAPLYPNHDLHARQLPPVYPAAHHNHLYGAPPAPFPPSYFSPPLTPLDESPLTSMSRDGGPIRPPLRGHRRFNTEPNVRDYMRPPMPAYDFYHHPTSRRPVTASSQQSLPPSYGFQHPVPSSFPHDVSPIMQHPAYVRRRPVTADPRTFPRYYGVLPPNVDAFHYDMNGMTQHAAYVRRRPVTADPRTIPQYYSVIAPAFPRDPFEGVTLYPDDPSPLFHYGIDPFPPFHYGPDSSPLHYGTDPSSPFHSTTPIGPASAVADPSRPPVYQHALQHGAPTRPVEPPIRWGPMLRPEDMERGIESEEGEDGANKDEVA